MQAVVAAVQPEAHLEASAAKRPLAVVQQRVPRELAAVEPVEDLQQFLRQVVLEDVVVEVKDLEQKVVLVAPVSNPCHLVTKDRHCHPAVYQKPLSH